MTFEFLLIVRYADAGQKAMTRESNVKLTCGPDLSNWTIKQGLFFAVGFNNDPFTHGRDFGKRILENILANGFNASALSTKQI